MLDRRLSIHKAFVQLLRRDYGERVCSTALPLSVDFKEAVALRQPITQYKPRSRAAAAIEALAAELTERMAELYMLPPQFQNLAISVTNSGRHPEAV